MSIRKRFMQMRVETGFPLNYPKLLLHSHTNTDELHTGVADDASPKYVCSEQHYCYRPSSEFIEAVRRPFIQA